MTVRTFALCCAPDFARGIVLLLSEDWGIARHWRATPPDPLLTEQSLGPAVFCRTHDFVSFQPHLARLRLRLEQMRSPRFAVHDLARSRHAEPFRRRPVRL